MINIKNIIPWLYNKGLNQTILRSSYGEVYGQIGIFKLGMTTSEGKLKFWIQTLLIPYKIDLVSPPTEECVKSIIYIYVHTHTHTYIYIYIYNVTQSPWIFLTLSHHTSLMFIASGSSSR